MAFKRQSKKAFIGVRIAVCLPDGYFYPGTIENVSEHSPVHGTTFYIGGLKNFPLKHMKAKEECMYGPGFQQVSQSTQLKNGQAVYITYHGREVSGHISGRLPKGKLNVSLDTEADDVVVRCENIRFMESRKSPRLNEGLQRVPLKRELSETIEVPEAPKLFFRLGDGEEYTPSPKTPKNDPLAMEGNDQDMISAAHALTHMSKSPSSPAHDSKDAAMFAFGTTTLPLSSPKSWNDSIISLGYHSQTSPSPSPHLLSTSAPAHDLANVSATSDDADMFSYFGGDLDQPKQEGKLRLQCNKRIKYVCTYPQCSVQCNSAAAIKAHVRTHIGGGINDSCLPDEEHGNIPEEEFYFDEVEMDELTSSISQMRTSTPPAAQHNPFLVQMTSQLLNQSQFMPGPASADGTPLSPVLARKFDHDYLRKDVTGQDPHDLLRAAFHQSLLTSSVPMSTSSPLQVSVSGAPLLSPAAVSALFPPLTIPGLNYQQASPLHQHQRHNLPQHSPGARPLSVSPKASHGPHSTPRRPRNDVKKCRKMYGLENRDQWCKDCKWKKACKRFSAIGECPKPEVMSLPVPLAPATHAL